MKLFAVVAILFSASVIAANQCRPDDVCISYVPFDARNKGFEVECKNIKNIKMDKNQYDMTELSFDLIEPIDIKNKSAVDYYSFGTLYILNNKYADLRGDTSVSSGMSIYVDGMEQVNAASALISCVKSLSSK
ncbi:TPA: hypothetical protein ACYSBI_001498 [Morganella morganii]